MKYCLVGRFCAEEETPVDKDMVHWAPTFMCREAVSTCPYSAKGPVITSRDFPVPFIPLFLHYPSLFRDHYQIAKTQYTKIMTDIL